MIGRTFPFGKGFLGLMKYLESGAAGEERERVAWTEFRNLPTKHLDAAARLMAATAKQSRLTQRPVYHLSISFDPGDPVDRESMRHVADAVLRRLGLSEYQAVIVAHNDTAHPHMHIVVNRVHPVHHKAWEKGWDWPKIEQELRAKEVELGLAVVPGWLAPVPGRKPAPALVRGDAAFLHRANEQAAPVLERAQSWAEVEQGLAAVGLAVRVKGGGLTIHDGQQEVKASELGRVFSRNNMEKRLGKLSAHRLALRGVAPVLGGTPAAEPEPVRAPAEPEPAPPPPVLPPDEAFRAEIEAEQQRLWEAGLHMKVRLVGELIRKAEAAAAMRRAHADATGARHAAWVEVQRLEGLDRTGKEGVNELVGNLLTPIYADPREAARALFRYECDFGKDLMRLTLRETPERFGTLRTPDELWRRVHATLAEAPAREAARAVVEEVETAIRAWRAMPGRAELDAARERFQQALGVEEAAREERNTLPSSTTLERQAADALRALLSEGVPEWWIRQELGRLLPPEDPEAGGRAQQAVDSAIKSVRGRPGHEIGGIDLS